ncbi:hypothetical protein Fcan01_26379 [Folsomia candida]|uniref:Uncharacterized protein n=1 Tax=Folsomia candida TaxID=158441 RepID=A0A226D210_FOLCA|nr:hypothetical protein Fcan01_26379 [Folsomia candida]
MKPRPKFDSRVRTPNSAVWEGAPLVRLEEIPKLQQHFSIIYDRVYEIEIERVANKFNIIGQNTPWSILPDWFHPLCRNIRLSEITKAGVSVDDVLLNLLLWRNSTTKFGEIGCYSFVKHAPHLAQNDTLLQDQCLTYGPDPSILNVRSSTNLELVTSLQPYGFLSCSHKRSRPSSLENLVYVFTWDLWTLLISTWFFLGLFVMLTWKKDVIQLYVLTTGYNILLEQGSSIVRNSKREIYLYFVFAPWILMSLIMTNLIRGDNVQSTIAPLRVVLYENFSQLISSNFTFVDSVPIVILENGVEYHGGWTDANTFSLNNIETSSAVISHKICKQLINLSVHHRRISEQTDIWNKISNYSGFSCASERIAYLGFVSDLEKVKKIIGKISPRTRVQRWKRIRWFDPDWMGNSKCCRPSNSSQNAGIASIWDCQEMAVVQRDGG